MAQRHHERSPRFSAERIRAAAAAGTLLLAAALVLQTSGCVDRRDVVILFGGDEHAWIVPAG